MKISTKGRYGTRFMLDLAINTNGGPIPLKDVAARQEISEKYLEQIIPYLSRGGLIRSIRGPQGGYMLSMPPKEITVGQILRTLEGPLAPVDCAAGDDPMCSRSESCATLQVWRKIHQAVENVVDNITLEDMMKDGDNPSCPRK